MTLARVFCGIAAADVAPWLTVAVVDDAGRLLDLRHLSDDPAGYAQLGGLLADRSGGVAPVALDRSDHLIAQLLAAARQPLAIADGPATADFAERFSDDTSYDEVRAPLDQRRAVGLARALQAGALYAAIQNAAVALDELKPVLSAHAAIAAGRQAAATALREVLRELYPAALRAYPDPAEFIPLKVLDALPEPGLLTASPSSRQRDAALIADLASTGVADAQTAMSAISALRASVEESPRWGNPRLLASVVAETVRQAVAAVRASDAASAALVSALVERLGQLRSGWSDERGAPARPYLAANAPVSPAPRRVPGPAAEVPPSRLAPRSSTASAAAAGVAAPVGAGMGMAAAPGFAASIPSPRPAPGSGGRSDWAPGPSRENEYSPAGPPADSGYADQGTYPAPAAYQGSGNAYAPAEGYSYPGAETAYAAGGYGSDGYEPNGYETNGYETKGYESNAYQGSGYDSSGFDGSSYSGGSPSGYPGGMQQPGYPPAAPPPGSTPPGYAAGGPPPGYGPTGSQPGSTPSTYQPLAAPSSAEAPPQSFDEMVTTLSFSPDPLTAPLQPPTSPAAGYRPASHSLPDAPAGQWTQTNGGGYPPPGAPYYQPGASLPGGPQPGGPQPGGPQPGGPQPGGPQPGGQQVPGGHRQTAAPDEGWHDSRFPVDAPGRPGMENPRPDPLTDPLPGSTPHVNGSAQVNGSSRATAEPDDDLLIFSQTQSVWFTLADEGSLTEPVTWGDLAADDGWRAAEQLTHPTIGDATTAGLPRRVPQANLVPGSAQSQRRQLRIVRDAQSIAQHTEGYFRGWRRGQEIGGYAVGQRDRAAWEFNRDQRARMS